MTEGATATVESPGSTGTGGAADEGVTISVQNLSTVMTDAQVELICAALQAQGEQHYNASCWVTQNLSAPLGKVVFVPKGEAIPADTWHMEVLDTTGQEGALGFHEDMAFDKAGAPTGPKKSSDRSARGLRADNPSLPLMKIGAQVSQQDGVQPSEVCSHEMLEALVDPQVVKEVRSVKKPAEGRIYIVEVCDPVQSTPGYTIDGLVMSNFVTPAYFGMPQLSNPTQYDWCRALSAQVPAMLSGGYLSYATEAEPENWQQEFGTPR